ncbi:hypothetical protein MMC25_007876 [Agyrium rufum]|nr:hypothetical protein [Agyrium rufum]
MPALTLLLDDASVHASQSVRQETAELANWALSDATTARSASLNRPPNVGRQGQDAELETDLSSHDLLFNSSSVHVPAVIDETSEPVSPADKPPSGKAPSVSTLTNLLQAPGEDQLDTQSAFDTDESVDDLEVVTVNNGIISQPHEQTPLLNGHSTNASKQGYSYGSLRDLESQQSRLIQGVHVKWHAKFSEGLQSLYRNVRSVKSWDRRKCLTSLVVQPASFVPPVILGLLLNILDALSYGMILFPLGEPIFAHLGPDGISMFYVSCIVSQLVYSLGGSIFRGGIGSEMIEVVPFFHKMAFTILARVGDDKPEAVLATTILSYSISSVLTGVVFYVMGRCNLGSLIGFFPRHILIGCIGGVGFFLVVTGIEVSARLDGNLEYDLATLKKLTDRDTAALWTVPLLLAIVLLTIKRWIKHPLTDATYFISIIAVFYIVIAAIPRLSVEQLRERGWVFEAQGSDVPFYHFYTLYDFKAVDWGALASTIPAMFALTFFGVLHVPINIPALALTTNEDDVSVDRELRAHGWSNALSGLCGSIQNYLVYTNTVLFIRSGGDSRVAGVLLAVATFGIMVVGPVIIGFIPVTVVASLIYFLGIDLLREALYDTWGRVHRIEYLTILVIVVTMGVWDFVAGILVGIVLACVSFVVQTSQVSAIRSMLPGNIASSTVRRHPVQHAFLQKVGTQVHVMKLAGFLFFSTISGVENRVRALIDEKTFHAHPIRFLVADLAKVDGIDFSAAEAFTRLNRILSKRNVQLIISGLDLHSDIGRSLSNVGLLDEEEDGVELFEDLNSALEFCENEMLKTLYSQRDALDEPDQHSRNLAIPKVEQHSFPIETMFSSPRRHQLEEVAISTLREHNEDQLQRVWQKYDQPLQLILQTFCGLSEKKEEFWRRTAQLFEHQTFAAGDILYSRGDRSQAFYLLESGILRADYKLPQGRLSELIVAGTTCGELPFFSSTRRTSTTTAEIDSAVWLMAQATWENVQKEQPDVAQEFLKISLKLTSERMDAITKFVIPLLQLLFVQI